MIVTDYNVAAVLVFVFDCFGIEKDAQTNKHTPGDHCPPTTIPTKATAGTGSTQAHPTAHNPAIT